MRVVARALMGWSLMLVLVASAGAQTHVGPPPPPPPPPTPMQQQMKQATEFFKTHYEKHEYRIAMRDGVKLYTQVYTPIAGQFEDAGPYPFLMTRTPYSCGNYDNDVVMPHVTSNETMLKSGYILGANPRKQFIAQFVGIFFGTLAIVPAWYAMVPTKQALEAMNPPATLMWKAVADLLTQGIHMLPVTAIWAIVIGAILGVALPLTAKLFPKAQPYLPSAMGLGLAWVMPFSNSLAFAIGALLVTVWNRLNKKSSDLYYVPVASGLIAGESLVAALIAIACTVVGLLAAT